MTQKIKSFQIELDDELLLSSDPINPLGAVTKQYVDAAIAAGAGVGDSLNTNGYTTLSSGLIIQWGVTTIPINTTNYSITYPISFPNSVFTVVAYGSNSSMTIVSIGLSSFVIKHAINLITTGTAYWVALGN